MRHGCRESPDGLQGRTLGAGLRGGGVREGSPTLSCPYAGQAFLVPFVAIDKRDSPEGAKQDGRADSVRRRNTQAAATGLFPFGPAQALFAMEPRPAFAGMTGMVRSIRMTPDSPAAQDGPLSLWERAGVRGKPERRCHSPARDFAGRARSYRLPGGTVFLPP